MINLVLLLSLFPHKADNSKAVGGAIRISSETNFEAVRLMKSKEHCCWLKPPDDSTPPESLQQRERGC